MNQRYMLFRVEAKNTATFLELVSEVVQRLEIENPRIVQSQIGVSALSPIPRRIGPTHQFEPEYESIFIHAIDGVRSSKDIFLAWCAFSVDPFGEVTLTRHSNALPTLGSNDRIIKTAADFKALMIEGWRSKAWRERHLNPLLPTWGMEDLIGDYTELERQDLFARGRIYLTDNADRLGLVVADAPVSIFSHPLFTQWFEADDVPTPLCPIKARQIIADIITQERRTNSAVAWYIPYRDAGFERTTVVDGEPVNLDNLLSAAYELWPQIIVVSKDQVEVANPIRPAPRLLTNSFKINTNVETHRVIDLERKSFVVRLVEHDDNRIVEGIALSMAEVFRGFTTKNWRTEHPKEFTAAEELAEVIDYFKLVGLKARLVVPVDFKVDSEGQVHYHGSFCEWTTDNMGRNRCESFDYAIPEVLLTSGEDYQVLPSAKLAVAVDAELEIFEYAKTKASD